MPELIHHNHLHCLRHHKGLLLSVLLTFLCALNVTFKQPPCTTHGNALTVLDQLAAVLEAMLGSQTDLHEGMQGGLLCTPASPLPACLLIHLCLDHVKR